VGTVNDVLEFMIHLNQPDFNQSLTKKDTDLLVKFSILKPKLYFLMLASGVMDMIDGPHSSIKQMNS
jgi:hypothetical protein